MTQTDTILKMVFDRWNGSLKNFDTILDSLSDEALHREIAPGKNRGIYLLGHLIAVHDDMLILLDMGDKMYSELNEPFIKLADKAAGNLPTAAQLRSYWRKQSDHMKELFERMELEQWFERHTAVSAEDFANEPHRNKLNIVITRTSHLNYHTGQLVLLK